MEADSLDCVIIGSGTLPVRCAEILTDGGHKVSCLVSSDEAVISFASETGITLLPPGRDLGERLSGRSFDYLFSINNGYILREDVLSLPRKLAINYHDTLLPAYAGMHATSWAILNGETLHGISWHEIVDEIDAGDILKQKEVAVDPEDTAFTLNAKCYEAAIEAFGELAAELSQGTEKKTPQDLSKRTYYALHKRPENGCVVSWDMTAEEIARLARALDFGPIQNPLGTPKIFTGAGFVSFTKAEIVAGRTTSHPGTIVDTGNDELRVSALDSDVILKGFRSSDSGLDRSEDIFESAGFKAGSVLPAPGKELLEAVSELQAISVKREAALVREIASSKPSGLPFPLPASGVDEKKNPFVEVPFPPDAGGHPSGVDKAMLLQTAFAVLVSRLNCAGHFASSYSDTQIRRDHQRTNGFVTDSVPFSLDFDPDTSTSSLLKRAEKRFLSSASSRLAADSVFRYSGPGNPEPASLEAPVHIATVETEEEAAVLECRGEILFAVLSDGSRGFLKFDPARFAETDIETLLKAYEVLVAGVLEGTTEQAGKLPLLSADDRRKVLRDWNETDAEIPAGATIHGLFEKQAERTPNAPAVSDRRATLSYRELNARANAIAAKIAASGAKTGTPVGICLTRNADLVAGLLGILKAGGTYIPIDPAYPKDRSIYILEDSRAEIVLTEKALAGQFRDAIIVEDIAEGSGADENPVTAVLPNDLAYVIYTSGSTGKPKGVAIEHRNAVALISWAHTVFTAEELKGVLASTSVCFDLSVFEIFVTLSGGGTVMMADSLLRLPDLPYADKVTLLNTVPSAIAELLRIGGVPSSVTTVNLAGEPLSDELVRKIYEVETVERVYDLYGPSEDTTYSTYTLRRPGFVTIGKPISNTKAFILDQNREPLPAGVPGELFLSGAGVARGYLHREELTSEKFIDEPFTGIAGSRMYRTGDLARYLPDGNIEYLGRIDNQVKIRGVRIELGEIEAVLREMDQVKDAVVAAFQRPGGGKDLAAFVVAEGNNEIDPGALYERLRGRLPHYMVPAAIREIGRIPLTPNGKVDRKSLEDPFGSAEKKSQDVVAPADETEAELIRIWESILETEPIGTTDNFFELGGNSLQAVRMFAEVEKTFGKNVPLATLFEADTVAKLAEILRQEGWLAPESCIVPIQTKGTRPAFFCFHAKGGNVLFYRELSNRLGNDQPFYGIQARRLGGRQVGHATVEEMADYYISEIRTVQPKGPYFLGGSSFGGLAAFEVAKKLSSGGERIGLVALLDTGTPDYPKFLPASGLSSRLMGLSRRLEHHRDTLKLLDAKGRFDYFGERIRKVRIRAWRLINNTYKKAVRSFYSRYQSDKKLPKNYIQIEDQIGRAARIYKPGEYRGDVVLFRATKQPLGIVPDESLGWGSHVGGKLEIHDVPGHHGSIVREPFVGELADLLRISITRAAEECRIPDSGDSAGVSGNGHGNGNGSGSLKEMGRLEGFEPSTS